MHCARYVPSVSRVAQDMGVSRKDRGTRLSPKEDTSVLTPASCDLIRLEGTKKGPLYRAFYWSDPTGVRTRVFAVRGRCPRPLDDGAVERREFKRCSGLRQSLCSRQRPGFLRGVAGP